MQGHGLDPGLHDFLFGGQIGGVGGIALGGQRQIDDGLGQGNEPFGHADALHGLGGGDGQRQGHGIGQADVLGGRDHEPAAAKARILAGFEHASQVVQGGVRVAAAYGFDHGRGQLVVGVAVAVAPGQGLGEVLAQLVRGAFVLGQGGGVFDQIKQRAAVARGQHGDGFQAFLGQLHAGLARAALGQDHELWMGQRSQAQDVQPGQELARDGKRRVFCGGGQQHDLAGLQDGQEKVLLRLGKAVQLIQDEDFLAFDQLAQGGQPGLRGADAHVGPALGPGQNQRQGGLAAARRAKQQQARQARRGQHVGQPRNDVGLTHEVFKLGRPDALGQGAFFVSQQIHASRLVNMGGMGIVGREKPPAAKGRCPLESRFGRVGLEVLLDGWRRLLVSGRLLSFPTTRQGVGIR